MLEVFWSYITQQVTPHFSEPGLIGVIEDDGGKLVGTICLRVTQLYYSEKPLLEELWNFVHPEHRKSNHAKALIAYAKRVASELQLPLLIGIVSNIRTEEKIKLYQRQGLPFAGAFFVFRGDLQETDKKEVA